jgi:hypothetical protein
MANGRLQHRADPPDGKSAGGHLPSRKCAPLFFAKPAPHRALSRQISVHTSALGKIERATVSAKFGLSMEFSSRPVICAPCSTVLAVRDQVIDYFRFGEC